MRNAFKATAICSLIILLAGCATPARIDRMTISSADTSYYTGNTPLKNEVMVGEVSGGKDTNPLWTSEIGNTQFQQALEESLKAARLLSPNGGQGSFLLKAQIISVQQPLFGIDMTVTTTVRYTLIEQKENKIVFAKSISSPYTATFSDAALGMERLKQANEGSARENITDLVNELYQLNIKPSAVSLQKL